MEVTTGAEPDGVLGRTLVSQLENVTDWSVYKRKSLCLEILGQPKIRKSYFWPLQIKNFTLKSLLLTDDQEVNFPHWLIKITFF